MNKTFDVHHGFDSDNGIYNAFYADVVAPAFSRKNRTSNLLKSVTKFHKAVTGVTAKRLTKVTLTTVSLLGLIGIAGGIQHGQVSLFWGILIALLCLGVEYLCLKDQA